MSELTESENQQQNEVNQAKEKPEKKKNKGCLIALIIVCAFFGFIFILGILGIVTAVSIPAFKKYVHESKAAEAKMNLKSIANGAIGYYETEHLNDAALDAAVVKSYPVAQTPVRIGPEMPEIGIKTMPPSADDLKGAWADLRFTIYEPHYYTYTYVSDGERFQAKAYASLSDPCDSIFVINGQKEIVSPIINLSETRDCSPAKLPPPVELP